MWFDFHSLLYELSILLYENGILGVKTLKKNNHPLPAQEEDDVCVYISGYRSMPSFAA